MQTKQMEKTSILKIYYGNRPPIHTQHSAPTYRPWTETIKKKSRKKTKKQKENNRNKAKNQNRTEPPSNEDFIEAVEYWREKPDEEEREREKTKSEKSD